jgi:hypothetical protein
VLRLQPAVVESEICTMANASVAGPGPPKKTSYTILDPNFFESIGLEMIQRDPSQGSVLTGDRRFKTTFGTKPEVVADVWNRLDAYNTINEKGVSSHHLLWGLMLLKVYAKEAILCTLAGGVDEKTFRKWAFLFVHHISFLEPEVVSKQPTTVYYVQISLTVLFLLVRIADLLGKTIRR